MDKMERLNNVDIVKGIAIITVTVCHILDVIFGEMTVIQKWGYSWEMFAFFLIGGLLLENHWNNFTILQFLIRQVKRTLYPYLMISLFYIVIYRGNGLLETLTFNGIGALWFLPTYFAGAVITFLLIKLLRLVELRRGINYTVAVFVVGSGGILLLSVFLSYMIQFRFYDEVWESEGNIPIVHISRIMMAAFAMGFGVCFQKGQSYLNSKNKALKIVLGLFLFLIGTIVSFSGGVVNFRYGYYSSPIVFYLSGIGISCGLLVLMERVKRSFVMGYIGKNSLIIFGLQGIVVKIALFTQRYIESDVNTFVIAVLISFIMIFAAIIVLTKTKLRILVRI